MNIKRLRQMENYIRSYNTCTYEEICERFDISLSTVRRDMDELEHRGIIKKIYGGVMYDEEDNAQPSDLLRSGYTQYGSYKDRIAEAAAALVEDQDIIILGSGTTVAHMAHHLANKKNITVITNNLMVIEEAKRYNFSVIGIGGNFDRNTGSFVGTITIKELENLNANKAFLSCNGFALTHGFSNVTDLEADIKKTTMKISSQTVILADQEKFDKMSLYKFAVPEQIHAVVTDKEPSEEYRKLLQKSHTRLIIAS
nr:DeoR/GlpR family DNA-binding transcription regulator [uncultured Blautia sp.]